MKLWLPNTVNYDAYRVDRAVNAYDERLMFARNEDTGDWCVFVRMPSPQDPFPVFGFGDRIPDPVEVLAKVQEGHLVKHKERIWKEITDSQKEYRKNIAAPAEEARDESVEAIEFMMRQEGLSPVVKSLPKGVSNDDA
jgi:hypothetical protein